MKLFEELIKDNNNHIIAFNDNYIVGFKVDTKELITGIIINNKLFISSSPHRDNSGFGVWASNIFISLGYLISPKNGSYKVIRSNHYYS